MRLLLQQIRTTGKSSASQLTTSFNIQKTFQKYWSYKNSHAVGDFA